MDGLTLEERIEYLEWKIQNFKDELLQLTNKLEKHLPADGRDAHNHQT